MSDSRPLVVYHANCPDGFCAAWVAHRKLGDDADYLPAQYGQDPPDVAGREVFILDFSYKVRPLLEIIRDSGRITVLDHHKTAEEELRTFRGHRPGGPDARLSGLTCVFDPGKSGGRLAWEHFFSGESAPWLVDYTEDRDLWRWRLPDSREVSAALASRPWTFAEWDALAGRDVRDLVPEGAAVLRYQGQQVERIVANAREVDLNGHKVLAVNTSVLFSEVADRLAEGRPFGAAWFERGDGRRVWSLRSCDGGVDVAEVAKRRGGGGHRNAAGFEE